MFFLNSSKLILNTLVVFNNRKILSILFVIPSPFKIALVLLPRPPPLRPPPMFGQAHLWNASLALNIKHRYSTNYILNFFGLYDTL